jgi:hypothetical protein
MSNIKWQDDKLQFARLIAELEAAGAFTASVMDDLCSSMNLSNIEISDVVDRAQKFWEEAKAMPTITELHAEGEMMEEYPAGRNNEDSEQVWEWKDRIFLVYLSTGRGEVPPGATVSEKIDDEEDED